VRSLHFILADLALQVFLLLDNQGRLEQVTGPFTLLLAHLPGALRLLEADAGGVVRLLLDDVVQLLGTELIQRNRNVSERSEPVLVVALQAARPAFNILIPGVFAFAAVVFNAFGNFGRSVDSGHARFLFIFRSLALARGREALLRHRVPLINSKPTLLDRREHIGMVLVGL